MNVFLYQTADPNNKVSKSLNSELPLSGVLRSECSVLNPTIEIETSSNIATFNYAFVQEFNRYYFITDIVAVGNNLWKVSMKCDVLMTYAYDIKGLTANIKRQKTDFNLMLEDSELPKYADDRVQCFNFPESLTPISGNQFKYYLTLIGGGA